MSGPASRERILVALDLADAAAARRLAERLAGRVGGFKVGLELFGAAGPGIVRELVDTGAAVFVDLKLHDIPNTVAGAAGSLARLGARWFTMHATGGPTMLRRGVEAAREAAAAVGLAPPAALAVTVLTSHDDDEIARIGLSGPCAAAVTRLALLAGEAGVDGLVCSPREVRTLRAQLPGRLLVVPGIRPAAGTVAADDQSRTATPAGAIADGADLLVIGRPITRAPDPAAAADAIAAELAAALGG